MAVWNLLGNRGLRGRQGPLHDGPSTARMRHAPGAASCASSQPLVGRWNPSVNMCETPGRPGRTDQIREQGHLPLDPCGLPRKLAYNLHRCKWHRSRHKLRGCMATLEDIAKRAKVSVRTVSNVLNGAKTFARKDAVRRAARVWHIAAELGYRPNTAARPTRRGRFGAVGVHQATDSGRGGMSQTVLYAIQRRAAERDVHLSMGLSTGTLAVSTSDDGRGSARAHRSRGVHWPPTPSASN